MLETIINICLFIIAILFTLTLLIKRFVYFHPSSNFICNPSNYNSITIGPLFGWFVKGVNNKVIVFCHGNAGNISHRTNKVNSLNKLGYNVLIFDYSGYGRSKGVPKEQTFYRDACVFTEKAVKDFGLENVIMYGESIGCPVAMYAARRYNVQTVILESALPSIKKLIKTRFYLLSWIAFLFPEFNTEEYIQGYKGRCLVLHSASDKIIPYSSIDVIRNNATKHIIINGSHNDPQINWTEIDDFIKNKNESV